MRHTIFSALHALHHAHVCQNKDLFFSETAESVKEDIQVLAGTVVMEKG